MKRLIIFLIRKRLGLKKYEKFRFTNQKSKADYYFFTDINLMKNESSSLYLVPSNVSLNWLLDDKCKIKVLKD